MISYRRNNQHTISREVESKAGPECARSVRRITVRHNSDAILITRRESVRALRPAAPCVCYGGVIVINDDDLISFRDDVSGDIRFDDSVVDRRPEDVG